MHRQPRSTRSLFAGSLYALAPAAAALTLLAGLLAGCAATTDAGGAAQGLAYPASADRLPPIDVHVIPEGRSIRLSNTSPAPLGPGRLWLNQWYSAAIDAIPVGATLTLPMTAFRDEHGDGLPGGGFFAAVAPERIVSAEVETAGGIAALVVIASPQ